MSTLVELLNQLVVVWALISNTWWLWLPFLLFFGGKTLWQIYLRVRYWAELKWVLLEIRIPVEVPKTPEAMEQVFAGLQTMYWGYDPLETWWYGLQHDYAVFEMVSLGGETHFYVRVPVFFKNVVEAHIYAQYPEAEIFEADDYMNLWPQAMPSEDWDIFGLEFKLSKEDAYPIKTYRDIMSLSPGQEEPEKVDPFSSIAETFGKLRPGEFLAYHLLIRPAQDPSSTAWREAGEALVAKLIGKKEAPKKSELVKALEPVYSGWSEPLKPLFGLEPDAAPVKKEEKNGVTLMQHLSPGIKDVVAAIERNILKPGFETVVRINYVARREMFHLSHFSAFVGAMKQYNTQTMNAFGFNTRAMATKTPWWWPPFMRRRRKAHKQRLFYQYFQRRKPFVDTWWWDDLKSNRIVLNTEELATIFHFPGTTTRAPAMPRLATKRGEPPSALPVG